MSVILDKCPCGISFETWVFRFIVNLKTFSAGNDSKKSTICTGTLEVLLWLNPLVWLQSRNTDMFELFFCKKNLMFELFTAILNFFRQFKQYVFWDRSENALILCWQNKNFTGFYLVICNWSHQLCYVLWCESVIIQLHSVIWSTSVNVHYFRVTTCEDD